MKSGADCCDACFSDCNITSAGYVAFAAALEKNTTLQRLEITYDHDRYGFPVHSEFDKVEQNVQSFLLRNRQVRDSYLPVILFGHGQIARHSCCAVMEN